MLACSVCTAAGHSRDARKEVRRDPAAHIHKITTLLPWEPKRARDYELVYVATKFKIEIAYGFIIHTSTCPHMHALYPAGLALYQIHGMAAMTGNEPVVDAREGYQDMMGDCVIGDRIGRGAIRHYSRVNPQLRLPLMKRTGTWVYGDGICMFVDLSGIIPPMRRTLGPRARSLIYAENVYMPSRIRGRPRSRACILVRWNPYMHRAARFRVRRGFTIGAQGPIVADDGTSADAYI